MLHVRRGRDPVGADRELVAIVAIAPPGGIRTRTLGCFPAFAHPGISQVMPRNLDEYMICAIIAT